MDKTGTITKGNFVVQTVSPSGSMKKEELLALAAACETASTHPIGISILAAARDQSLSVETPRDLAEIPGKGIRAVTSAGSAPLRKPEASGGKPGGSCRI